MITTLTIRMHDSDDDDDIDDGDKHDQHIGKRSQKRYMVSGSPCPLISFSDVC